MYNPDDETMYEIMEEHREYAENSHRSEEDGWFYSDDDSDN
jgi:hypothetical protein